MLLLIDNYDSFTYNLAQYLGELGEDVRVVRNDDLSVTEVRQLKPQRIVVSPGPCTPNQAGISVSVIRELAGTIPILGVCLGHQAIAAAFGAKIVRANQVMHGKVSNVFHDEQGVFRDIPNPFQATRYHSLIIDPATLPNELVITAKTWQDEIMGIRHRRFSHTHAPLEGVQFHPESIMTPEGMDLLANFINHSAPSSPNKQQKREEQS